MPRMWARDPRWVPHGVGSPLAACEDLNSATAVAELLWGHSVEPMVIGTGAAERALPRARRLRRPFDEAFLCQSKQEVRQRDQHECVGVDAAIGVEGGVKIPGRHSTTR